MQARDEVAQRVDTHFGEDADGGVAEAVPSTVRLRDQVLAGTTWAATRPAAVATDQTRRPLRVRALNGPLTTWTSRGASPVHWHRVNDGSWCRRRATAYLVVSPTADSAYSDAHRFA